MATTSKRSLKIRIPLLMLSTVFVYFMAVSCNDRQESGVWIPTPPDSSSLGKIDHFIPRDQMDVFKKQFQGQKDSIMGKIEGLFIPSSEAFNKKWLLEVLKDPKCVGIRIYYGVKSQTQNGNEFRLMIVGVDEQGNDLYITNGTSPAAAQAGGTGKDGGLEWGQCEPPCSTP